MGINLNTLNSDEGILNVSTVQKYSIYLTVTLQTENREWQSTLPWRRHDTDVGFCIGLMTSAAQVGADGSCQSVRSV